MLEIDARGDVVEVEDLGAAGLLELANAVSVRERIETRNKLRLAHQWCVLHPATEDSGVETPAGPNLCGLTTAESLGGEGTPLVAAFAPEPFAAALGVSPSSASALLADVLDLIHRLPKLWARVDALDISAWKARRIAQLTHTLSQEAAAYVDERLSVSDLGGTFIEAAVAQAVASFHPDEVDARERRGKHAWDVRLEERRAAGFDGTSDLSATGDTLDLRKFYDLVCHEAGVLGALGDSDPLGARKAKALGVIADRQASLNLGALDLATGELSDPAPRTGAPAPSAKTRLYVHLDLHELDDLTAVGAVERLGPATIGRIREWVGHSQVTIVPVVDRGRSEGVDPHEPPAWMRELVILRDPHCVFPGCERDSRACDLDHIIPYDPGDETAPGPPGQTSPDGLAPLCRRHHRLKTHGRWRYSRAPNGGYTWTDPYGHTHRVTPSGTLSYWNN
jgi:hypothetical protein